MASSTSTSNSTQSALSMADNKILADLAVVSDKIKLCHSMMTGTDHTESSSYRDTIGFLEACQPRLIELVQAAAQGALSEQVLMQCLDLNDQLTNLMANLDHATPAASAGPKTTGEDDIDLLGMDKTTTKSEDEFDSFFNKRASGGGAGGGTF